MYNCEEGLKLSEQQCSNSLRSNIQYPSQPDSGEPSVAEFEQDFVSLLASIRISKSHRMKPTSLVCVDVLRFLYYVHVIHRHWDKEKGLGVEISELSKSSRRVFYLSWPLGVPQIVGATSM
jgi:hypothetical protein